MVSAWPGLAGKGTKARGRAGCPYRAVGYMFCHDRRLGYDVVAFLSFGGYGDDVNDGIQLTLSEYI